MNNAEASVSISETIATTGHLNESILGEQWPEGLCFVFKYLSQQRKNKRGSFNLNHVSDQCAISSVLEA